jgi:hypothetical protein
MERKVKYIELRTSDGKVILSLYLFEKEVVLEDDKEPVKEKQEAKEEKGETAVYQPDEPMTSAQKRYLFRILAERGIEGEKAHQYLKELFQVNSLKEVTKLEASKMIDYLLGETKGGDEDDRIPF